MTCTGASHQGAIKTLRLLFWEFLILLIYIKILKKNFTYRVYLWDNVKKQFLFLSRMDIILFIVMEAVTSQRPTSRSARLNFKN